MQSIPELVQSATFIFSGTVLGPATLTLTLPYRRPKQNLIAARLDRGIRIDPVLGDLRGKSITVALKAPETLRAGQQAVFFATSWIHGRGIAVREVSRVDISEEGAVTAAVAELPEKHLKERLQQADLVVLGEVVAIDAPKPTFDQHAALWAAAHVRVDKTVKGSAHGEAILHFPTAGWPPWDKAPRYKQNQRGLFILRAATPTNTKGDASVPAGTFVALDHADFQEESQMARVEQLLASQR